MVLLNTDIFAILIAFAGLVYVIVLGIISHRNLMKENQALRLQLAATKKTPAEAVTAK